MRVALPADVLPWKYRKLLSNITNAFQALLGRTEGMGRLVAAAQAEGRAVLDAAGIAYTSDEDEAAARADSFEVRPVPGVDEVLGGSTWQSLTRGTGNVETDYLNGELVRIARRHGREAPINATMATLVRQAAARGDRPGDLSLEQLTQMLSPWVTPEEQSLENGQ
jgi:2-dehydropantoate 2-reductase